MVKEHVIKTRDRLARVFIRFSILRGRCSCKAKFVTCSVSLNTRLNPLHPGNQYTQPDVRCLQV